MNATRHGSAESDEIAASVKRAADITLTDAPRLIVLDAGAIWDSESELAARIVEKLGILAAHENLRIAVRGLQPSQRAMLERATPHDQLVLGADAGPVDLDNLLSEQHATSQECIAILWAPGARVPSGCMAFYCGHGNAPAHAHPTRMRGSRATDHILALYGTALIQERAGIAFRSTSQGDAIPRGGQFNPAILRGILRAAEQTAVSKPSDRLSLPDSTDLRQLARAAFDRLVRNVLPNGAVVGSPARGTRPGEPNYWFYWQRDGATTMRHLITWHTHPPLGIDTRDLGSFIGRYLQFVAQSQRHGHLGTSRYNVEGKPILGYGNPQLDGPALSALTLATLPDPTPAWPQLKGYLEFLLTPDAQGPTMDMWEFIYGRIFNAEFLQRQALLAGAHVAAALGHSADAARYQARAQHVDGQLSDFLDPQSGRLMASRATDNPWFQAISGLDSGVIAAYLHVQSRVVRDLSQRPGAQRSLAGIPDGITQPAVLATMMALEDAFESLYQVNRDWRTAGNTGWGLGRFPEDANDGLGSLGGNPWPLATLWAAQFYYWLALEVDSILEHAHQQVTFEDPRQAAFFQRMVDDHIQLGRPLGAAAWYDVIVPHLLARGDGYLNFVVHHIPADGGVTEQVDKETGEPRGARDLSWALSELIATIVLREQTYAATRRQ
jgi:glucoamylase